MFRIKSLLFSLALLSVFSISGPVVAQDSDSTEPTVAEESVEQFAETETEEAEQDEASAESEQIPIDDLDSSVSYNLKLRAIEERVNQLKEKIFQSKARLIQLQEVVLHGSIAGAKAVIVHNNEMGSSFRLQRAQYALDGTPIFNRVDLGSGDLGEQENIEIFSGSIAPGTHQISVFLEYSGHGYGVFSYLNGYNFKIKSSYTFTAEEGKATTVTVVGYERGGITTQLADRPAVRYDTETTQSLRANGEGTNEDNKE